MTSMNGPAGGMCTYNAVRSMCNHLKGILEGQLYVGFLFTTKRLDEIKLNMCLIVCFVTLTLT